MKANLTLKRVLPFAFGAILLMGGGCSKDEVTAVAPVAYKAKSNALPKNVSVKQVESAWQDFVDRIERGEATDPLGQYVSKNTTVSREESAKGISTSRPKYDASINRQINITRQSGKIEIISLAATKADNTSSIVPDPTDNPPQPTCPDDGCETVYMPPVAPIFVTSERRGGGGSISDLKIISNSAIRNQTAPNGYEKLDLDLNKGAGGSYIYLCFTRNPSAVLNGTEYYKGNSYSGPNDLLRKFMVKESSLFGGIPSPDFQFFHIWTPNQNPYIYWDRIDLNAGAKGKYLYPYQSKSPVVNGINTDTKPIFEIAILAGNNDRIQPPSGWKRYDQDLNEGSGGDYIYFCYKQYL